MAARRLIPWLLLVAAALVMVLRAPVYLTGPNFWAEEGSLYFAVAWERPLWEALSYRPAGYLLWWANLSTATAATLVRVGLVPLARAPQVTALFALAAQLLPMAIIAWGRAALWRDPPRRVIGIGVVLLGALTDEIWLNTVNSQPWFVLAAALLLLEPADAGRAGRVARAAALAVAGLSAPVAGALTPLFAWRAWRARSRQALVEAGIVAACALVQLWCVWLAARGGSALPARGAGIDLGTFASLVWLRGLVAPLAGVSAAERLAAGAAAVGPLWGLALLLLAAALVGWLAWGLAADERGLLAGAWALVTAVTWLAPIGDPRMLLRSPWSASRYGFASGVLVLLMLLGATRPEAGTIRRAASALVLAAALVRGAMLYPSAVRWRPGWPSWATEVTARDTDPRRPLRIWPPPWTVTLRR